MQCSPPICGFNCLPSFGQYYPYNSPVQPQNQTYPEVVGEGALTSVVLSNGTVQYYFLPTSRRWPSFPQNGVTPHANSGEAWFIRPQTVPFSTQAISPPVTSASLQQPINHQPTQIFQQPYQKGLVNQYSSDHDFNVPCTGYQLKFHNDGCTSTTDLHYFYPTAERFENVLMASTKHEVQNPMCFYEIVAKPCYCLHTAKDQNELQKSALRSIRYCLTANENCSSMSIVECENDKKNMETNTLPVNKTMVQVATSANEEKTMVPASTSASEQKTMVPASTGGSNHKIMVPASTSASEHRKFVPASTSRRESKTLVQKSTSGGNIKTRTSNKLVTTYADCGCVCVIQPKRKKQVPKRNSQEVEVEYWYPKT